MYCRDYAGSNEQLVSLVPGLTVCGSDSRIGAMNKRVKNNDTLKVYTHITIIIGSVAIVQARLMESLSTVYRHNRQLKGERE